MFLCSWVCGGLQGLTESFAIPLCCFTTRGRVTVRARRVVYTIVSHLQGAPSAGVTGIVEGFLGWGTQLDVIVSADNLELGVL